MRKGVVLRDEGSQVVVDLDGEEVPCVIRKTLRMKAGRRKPVVVGDRVQVESGAVVGVEPRRSLVSRTDPGDRRREQILVANIDTVLVVASTRSPDLAPGVVDRFLVAAESRELEASIVINKIDLDPEGSYEPVVEVYRGLGYAVVAASAATGEGLDLVRALLAQHTTTMLGHSGTGKSSLANALDPSLALRTGEVQEASGKGAHTTTTVSLLRLPWGGYLVDTPGIREFGLWQMQPADLGVWFREFAERIDHCRFNDCLHRGEPGCAVKAAVDEGGIVRWRYESYLRILEGLTSG